MTRTRNAEKYADDANIVFAYHIMGIILCGKEITLPTHAHISTHDVRALAQRVNLCVVHVISAYSNQNVEKELDTAINMLTFFFFISALFARAHTSARVRYRAKTTKCKLMCELMNDRDSYETEKIARLL